jgi:GT2 family glycosyltransferase
MKLVIGVITYGEIAAKYLPYFLLSLKKQTFTEYKVLVFDNSEQEDNSNKNYFKKNYPEINFEWAGSNLGFAKGFNKLIDKARKYNPEFFMMLNFDMILELDMIEKMIKVMEGDGNLGSVSPKIKSWDFNTSLLTPLLNRRGELEIQGKTNIIDSCGIVVKPGLKFVDVGQGQVDEGQFDASTGSAQVILGPSGTAPIYRMSALEKTSSSSYAKASDDKQSLSNTGEGGKGDYFDELMFMYKEDCDMVYRLFLAGYTSRLVRDAICYHDRTVKAKGESNFRVAINRRNKSKQSKKWSFLNQQIIFVKYWRLQSFVGKLAIVWHQFKILVFIILFEQYLLLELVTFFKIRKKIRKY